MQLSLMTDYALRTLMYLHQYGQGAPVSLQRISDFYRIKRNLLTKVSQRLVELGYVASARGKGGGIWLHVPADRIVIGEVVAAFETQLMPIDCAKTQCPLTGQCALQGRLGKAAQAFMAELNQCRLSELCSPVHPGQPIAAVSQH